MSRIVMKPCPFCAKILEVKEDMYIHPANTCVLSDMKFKCTDRNVCIQWNTRPVEDYLMMNLERELIRRCEKKCKKKCKKCKENKEREGSGERV